MEQRNRLDDVRNATAQRAPATESHRDAAANPVEVTLSAEGQLLAGVQSGSQSEINAARVERIRSDIAEGRWTMWIPSNSRRISSNSKASRTMTQVNPGNQSVHLAPTLEALVAALRRLCSALTEEHKALCGTDYGLLNQTTQQKDKAVRDVADLTSLLGSSPSRSSSRLEGQKTARNLKHFTKPAGYWRPVRRVRTWLTAESSITPNNPPVSSSR